LVVILAFVIFFPSSPGADTTIVFQEAKDSNGKPSLQNIYIRSGMVRLENDSGDGNYIIYKSEANSMTVVDTGDKSYITIDRKLLADVSGPMSASQKNAMKKAHEKIASLPPEKQAQMRSIMEYVMQYSTPTGKKSEKVRYIPLQQELVINGNTCRVIETHQGKRKLSKLCMVDRNVLNIPLEDYASLQKLQSFIAEMNSRSYGRTFDKYFPDMGYADLEQFPVQVMRYRNNGVKRVLTLVRVTTEPIRHNAFVMPAGYQQLKGLFEGNGIKEKK
jgi:hypothetical protein